MGGKRHSSCQVCGDDAGAGPLGPCPGCRAPLHGDCLRFAGCSACGQEVENPHLEAVAPPSRPARVHRRALACALDTGLMLIPGIMGIAAGFAGGLSAPAVFAMAVAGATAMGALNVGLFLGEGGATLGQKVVGLSVRDSHGRRLGWRRALLRESLYKGVSTLGLGAGYLGPLLREDGRTWHDRAADCQVYEEPLRALPAAGSAATTTAS